MSVIYRPILFFILFMLTFPSRNCTLGECIDSLSSDRVLITNSVDGAFTGIDADSGRVLWTVTSPPLVSQSLGGLNLLTKTHHYSVVPSLDGQLYILQQNISHQTWPTASLKPLPLNVDLLFSSRFFLTDDSVLTGGKDNSVFSFDPLTGKVLYNCSQDGCHNRGSSAVPAEDRESYKPMILVYHTSNIVRAVHVPTGSERWNLSIRTNDLCLVRGRPSVSTTLMRNADSTCGVIGAKEKEPTIASACPEEREPEPLELEFNLDQLIVVARTRTPPFRTIWSHEFSSRIVKSWIYDSSSETLQSIQLFSRHTDTHSLTKRSILDNSNPTRSPQRSYKMKTFRGLINIFRSGHSFLSQLSGDRRAQCSSRDQLVYLGMLDGQPYIQLEDGFDGHSPAQIDLLNVPTIPTVSPASKTTSGSALSVSHLVGYYHTSCRADSVNSICKQPFLTDAASTDWTGKQTGLVPWSPNAVHYQDIIPSPFPSDRFSETPLVSPKSSEFSDWMVDTANDLLMLIFHANELSARTSHEAQEFPVPSFFHKYLHVINILLLTFWIWLVDRTFRSVNRQVILRPLHPFGIFPTLSSEHGSSDSVVSCPMCSTVNNSASESKSEDQIVRTRQASTSCGTQSLPEFNSTYENEFKFVRCLGRGGFGRVFEAENRFDGCRYAIKRIQIDERTKSGNKFLREVKALASLDHPGIVRYHRAWSECPPVGWQEARDRLMFGESDEDVCNTEASLEPRYLLSSQPPAISLSSTHETQPSLKSTKSSNSLPSASPPLNGHLSEDSLIIFQPDEGIHPTSYKGADTNCTCATSAPSFLDKMTSAPLSDSPQVSYLYIQMQLCSPVSLRDWLAKHNSPELRPPLTDLLQMFRQIVDAVTYLHDRALMHRDLKPSNILFDLTDRLKLADFGLVTSMFDDELRRPSSVNGIENDVPTVPVKHQYEHFAINGFAESKRSSDSGTVNSSGDGNINFDCSKYLRRHTAYVGTDLYMSPEQERGDPYDYKVDIFSLGLVLLELLIPFHTNMERVCTLTNAKMQQLPTELVEHHPDEASFIRLLLDPIPSNRPSARRILSSNLFSQTTTISVA